MKKDAIFPSLIVLLVIIFLVISVLIIARRAENNFHTRVKREQIELYDAWVKVTGNPKQLTQEEFIALKKNFMLRKIKNENK